MPLGFDRTRVAWGATMSEQTPELQRKQALRLRRFLNAAVTYGLGALMLALCSAAGLVPTRVVWIGLIIFLVPNVVFATLLMSGLNLRFKDPSLTLAQVLVAATTVVPILALGPGIHFLAVPYYSSLFVFAMLQLRRRELVVLEIYVLSSYGLAFVLRQMNFGAELDLRVEGIHAALVVLSSLWYAVAAGTISRLRSRLRESLVTIEHLATRDVLTDTFNRRHIDALLTTELQRIARIGGDLCVCLADVDRFKSINDRFGHPAGDAVLHGVAGALKAQLRTIDMLGRYGGEEFMIVLPGTPLIAGRACAERVRGSVSALQLLPGSDERVTVSIGLAEWAPGDNLATLVARADEALYRAKHSGRDRVEAAAAPPRARLA